MTGSTRDALAQLRRTHLWESSLNPTTSRFAVDGPAHVEGLDRGARRIDWACWPALIPLALEAYDGPRPIGLADCDERRWSVSTGNPLLDQLARGLGNFRSGGAGGALEATPAYAIKYLVCDSGLSDEELGAFLAAGGAEPYNGSDYLEAFQSVAGVEIERPARAMYGGPSARESAIENGMRVARALRAAPDAVEYLFRIQRKQCSDECVMKIDLLEPARRTYYQSSWHAATPASLSELATEEGLERFRDHRRRFMEAAKLAVEPADADRVAALERLESRLEAVQPVIERLKETGWTFGSHTWGHIRLDSRPLESVQRDTVRWAEEVGSLVGPTNILFYPHGGRPDGDDWHSTGPVFQYLQSQGFRIFASVGINSFSYIKKDISAVICDRLHPDGTTLRNGKALEWYSQFYDALEIIDLDVRPDLGVTW